MTRYAPAAERIIVILHTIDDMAAYIADLSLAVLLSAI